LKLLQYKPHIIAVKQCHN